jgi:hypothetical protein
MAIAMVLNMDAIPASTSTAANHPVTQAVTTILNAFMHHLDVMHASITSVGRCHQRRQCVDRLARGIRSAQGHNTDVHRVSIMLVPNRWRNVHPIAIVIMIATAYLLYVLGALTIAVINRSVVLVVTTIGIAFMHQMNVILVLTRSVD